MFCFAEKQKNSRTWHIVFVFFTMIIGVYVNDREIFMDYHLQTSILAIPVIYLGYWVKCNWEKLKQYVNWYGTIVAAFIIYGILLLNIGVIELSVNFIIHPLLFYPVTLCGIYFCLGVGQLIDKSTFIKKIFVYIGKNSFHIMALHFLAFKLVDVFYGKLNHVDYTIIEKFPHAFEFWILYYFVGILFPLGVLAFGKKLLKLMRKV